METRTVSEKVLVLCATGKLGLGVSCGLKAAGFDVAGSSRGAKGVALLGAKGIRGLQANYVVRADVDRAITESGAKKLVFLTDFFLAAGHSQQKEVEQGCMMVDAAKAAGCEHVVFLSVGDADSTQWSKKVKHIPGKVLIENYLKASGVPHSILRPVAFFENFDVRPPPCSPPPHPHALTHTPLTGLCQLEPPDQGLCQVPLHCPHLLCQHL